MIVVVFCVACGDSVDDERGMVVRVGDEDAMMAAPDADGSDMATPTPDAADSGMLIDGAQQDAAGDAGMMGESLRACETTAGVLPDDVVTIEFHDGEPVGDVSAQEWSVLSTPVSMAPLHESVVFELERPARVLGYAVQYGALPESPEASLAVSLHPDFGYNGFDFWAADPLVTAQRCRSDATSGEWVEFVLPEPVEVADPGLIHLAHRRSAGGAAWLFDGTPPTADCTDDCCSAFGACHSAWNFPELRTFISGGQQNYAYNGLSLTFRYDYMVRLYVQYTDDIAPEETVFTRVPDLDTSNRMAWGDYDNDGDDDLLVNGPRLLRNDGGTFTDVTSEARLDVGLSGTGIFGDYDNDGCLDLFLFNESYTTPDYLVRSDCNGGFDDVTEASGITDTQEYMTCDGDEGTGSPTPAAAWFDIDGDGFLDLYVGNFICWSSGRSYLDTIWRARGDGTFQEWTGRRGFAGVDAEDAFLATRGVLPADFDADGDVDLLVNTYRLNRNLYYRNDGARFMELGREFGLSGRLTRWQGFSYYGHHIGAAVGDLDGDQDLDVVMAALAHPRFFDFSAKTEVLINQGDGRFEDIQGEWASPAGAAGLRYQETHSVPTLGDFDNDGALDLVISAIYDGRPTDFYWGNGDGTFRLDAWRSGIDVRNGWGQAAADFDHDGRLDIATSYGLYRNQREHPGHWLQTRVVGNVNSNRAGIGATVYVEAGEQTFVRVIGGGTGQGCQDSLSPHFGLGAHQMIDRIRVRFPGWPEAVVYEGPFDADQRIWLYEDGQHATGWRADW
jgi:enediyne biosynthesis protein E4